MVKKGRHHEWAADNERPAGGTDRGFGFVFAVASLVVAAILWWIDSAYWPWAIGASAAFLALALVFPKALAPLNKVWTLFGLLLHRIVSPLVMGFMFFVVVTPIGLLLGRLGKRPLSLDFDPKAKTYWVEREPPGPAPETMSNQF